jgi:hypothetical protein
LLMPIDSDRFSIDIDIITEKCREASIFLLV